MVPNGYQSSFVVESRNLFADELPGEHLRQCAEDLG